MNRSILFTFSIIAAFICAYAQEVSPSPSPVKLHILGEVDSLSETKTLLITTVNGFHNPLAEVPVVNGKIDFVFETSEPDRLTLNSLDDMYNGSWLPMDFFAEDGQIILSGETTQGWSPCPQLKLKLVESHAPLNQRLMECKAYEERVFTPRIDSIANLIMALGDESLSTEGKQLINELNALIPEITEYPDSMPLLERRSQLYQKMDAMRRDRTMNSEEYYRLYDQSKAVSNERFKYELATYCTADGDLFSLSLLLKEFMMSEDNDSIREQIIDVYNTNFKDRFSKTAMGRRMDEAVVGYEVSHVGGRYPDYQLPDANGDMHSIKDLINGRMVLIDLWGSTCGPCRINSRRMIPIYNDFKDKDFDIIGIAREYVSLDGFHHAVEKDGYPWQQLIELDDASGIFNLHGIPNSMGGTFLVGPSKSVIHINSETNSDSKVDGSDIHILMINPTPEELRDYLTKYYNSEN